MRILLVLDGSVEAVNQALLLAVERKARVCALFASDDGWRGFTGNDWLSTSGSYTGFLEWVEGQEMDEARRVVEDFARRATSMGVDHQVKVTRGGVSKETLKELEEGYDLLVMPHPLRRGLESMKDAGAAIIKKAPCSLLLVRPGDSRDC